MKRRPLTILFAVVATMLSLTFGRVAPAGAGEGFWSATACHAELPYNAAWLGTPGVGASYTSVFVSYDIALQWVTWNGVGQAYVQLLADTHAYYAAAGYECGRFGLPYKEGLYQSPDLNYRWTYFVRPGDCDMRYIIHVFETGVTYEGTAPNFFCQ
jgi:hypothetical protein